MQPADRRLVTEARLSDALNSLPQGSAVTAFGAVGDGVADDTQAVQTALNASQIVYFPPGDYLVGQLTVNKGQTMTGAGSGTYTWTGSAYINDYPTGSVSRIIRKAGTNASLILGPAGAKRVTLRDLQFDGNNKNQTSGSPYVIEIASIAGQAEDTQWNIEDCYVHGRTDPTDPTWGSGGSNIFVGTGRQAVHILNTISNYANNHGIEVSGADVLIDGCLVGDNGSQGIVLSAWVAKVTGCDIWNNNHGIYIPDGGNSAPRRILISRCGIDRNKQHGIILDKGATTGAGGVSIVGNAFTSNSTSANATYDHIIVKATTGLVIIADNVFSALESGYSNTVNSCIYLDTGATATGGGNVYESGALNGLTNAPLQLLKPGVVAQGTATLVAGTVTVSTSLVGANSRIRLSYMTASGTPGSVFVNARTAGTSFVIKSTSSTDTSVIFWEILL